MDNITIENVAPVLRMLLANRERLPVIRFEENNNKGDKGILNISLKENSSQEQIIEQLTKAVKSHKGPIDAVNVEGLGVFRVIKPADDLQGKVTGKVVIVTGAAQGFGLEIARDMASEGAYVFLADVNLEKAQQQAKVLKDSLGQDRSFALGMDVTNKDSIHSAISEVVKLFGGFDVFISNAGILLAQSVKTQPEKDFDLVTKVNYKGYFLCVQQAAPVLALQHKVNPSYAGDIIQINSKSGLKGSNKNFAYAGSKFGGIGLTQSFALELIEDGIKVNSICPGNFFDGPLWSDPENGLFAQYLRAGKVKGAKTIADVRKAYEAKVPMGRGCKTTDVTKAIYYLIEQKYETGQALPVTGGQIMLH
ncbi:MAG: SDR family NAD(P)-dependent oxidoreductase [Sedimentisphaerales bacterium]|nr:SDR family NAD(P)-dependent oxidoreductase [Sedimentisphaerales bacterium]